MKILKTSFFVLFFSLMLNSVNAQGWGVRAGANFSTLSGGENNIDSQTGYYLGLYKQLEIIPKLLYIQPELQYSKQGYQTSVNDYDLTYIQVPIVAKLYLVKILSIETGPQFGFLVGDSTNAAFKPDYNTFETAWDFGLGINLPFGLSIEGRYITSLNDVSDNINGKNQVFQIGAGLKF